MPARLDITARSHGGFGKGMTYFNWAEMGTYRCSKNCIETLARVDALIKIPLGTTIDVPAIYWMMLCPRSKVAVTETIRMSLS